MTDDLSMNSGAGENQVVTGEEARDQLVGQAASSVTVPAPTSEGQVIELRLESGQQAVLDFDAAAATPQVEGNNFVLAFDSNGDGAADSRVVFLDLVAQAQGDGAPTLVIGGVEIAAGQLVGQALALADGDTLETAAGPQGGQGAQGGGGSRYSDDTGEAIELLDAQDTIEGTGLEFGTLATGEDETDPAEGTIDVTFLTVQTVVGEGGEGEPVDTPENYVSGSFAGGFEDWQPNQHLGDETAAPMQVIFTFTPADNETLDSIDITGLPEGVTLYVGGTDAANIVFSNVSGEEVGSLPLNIDFADLDSVFLQGTEYSDADLTVVGQANITDPDSGLSASLPFTSTAVVDAAADKPELDFGGENSYIKIASVYEDDFSNLDRWEILDGSGVISVNDGEDSALWPLGGGEGGEGEAPVVSSTGGQAVAEFLGVDVSALNAAADNGDAYEEHFEFGDGSAVKSTLTVEAGQTLSFDFNFLNFEEGAYYNDTAFIVINGEIHVLGQSASGSEDGVFHYTFTESGEVEIGIAVLNEGDMAVDPALILENLNITISTEGTSLEEESLVTIPVEASFPDFADGSETHSIVLNHVPADWDLVGSELYDGIVTGPISDPENPGFVSYIFDVTDLVDAGNGSIELPVQFDPNDWSSDRLDNGETQDYGAVAIEVQAIASEENLSGDDLTDLNDVAITTDYFGVDIVEDIPVVKNAAISLDETEGNQTAAEHRAGHRNYEEPVGAAQERIEAAVEVLPEGVSVGEAISRGYRAVNNWIDMESDGVTDANPADAEGQESIQFVAYDGQDSGLNTTNGGDIFLFSSAADPAVVFGVIDPVTDEGGNLIGGEIALVATIDSPLVNEDNAIQMYVEQYESLEHPNEDSHNETIQLNLDYFVTDDEGDQSNTAKVTISFKDDGPTVSANAKVVADEDDLPGGIEGGEGDEDSANLTGTLGHDYGADGAGTVLLTGATLPDGFTASVNEDGTVLTISQGDTEVLQVSLADTISGDYTVTQLAAIDHPEGDGENNVDFTLSYEVTDGDGDTATGSFTITVDDDTPVFEGAANENLIVNGSFETTPDFNGWTTFDSIEGWTSPSGLIEVQENGVVGNAQDGNNKVELDAYGNSEIAQTVSGLNEGETYELSFYYKPRIDNGSDTDDMLVKWNGEEVLALTSTDADGWTKFTVKLVAAAGDNVLSFAGDGSSNGLGALLDNVSLVAIDVDEAAVDFGGEGGEGASFPSVTGDLGIAFGADGPDADVSFDTAAYEALGLTSGLDDTPLSYSVSGNTLTASADGEEIFTLSIDPVSGDYTFTLKGPLDHADGDGSNTLSLALPFTASDADGDPVDGYVAVVVQDDVPRAGEVYAGMMEEEDLLEDDAENPTLEGQLDVDFGTDGGQVSGIAFAGWTDDEDGDPSGDTLTSGGEAVVFADAYVDGGNLVYIGSVGDTEIIRVEIDQDSGDYAVTLSGPVDHPDISLEYDSNDYDPIALQFDYTVTDGDGDTATAKLFVAIEDDEVDSRSVYADDDRVIDEATLTDDIDGNSIISGTLEFGFGADGGELTDLWFDGWEDYEDGDPDGSVLTSGGEEVVFDPASEDGEGNLVLVGKVGDSEIITVTISKETGDYEIELLGPVDQPDHGSHNTNPWDPIALTFRYLTIDGDGDEDISRLEVVIEDDQASAKWVNMGGGQVAEVPVGAFEGNVFDAGAKEGADGAAVTDARALTVKNRDEAANNNSDGNVALKSGGQDVTVVKEVAGDGTITFTASAGDVTVYTMMIAANGNYSFQQFAPIDHPDVGETGGDDVVRVRFRYTLTDGDGDTSQKNLIIDITDDGPVAVEDEASTMASGNSGEVEGNVLDNDDLGADGGRVSQVSFNGVDYAVPADGEVEVAGDYGTLTISSDGSYSYTPIVSLDGGSDLFDYEVTDGDGDTAGSTLSVDVAGLSTDVEYVATGWNDPKTITLEEGDGNSVSVRDYVEVHAASFAQDEGVTLVVESAKRGDIELGDEDDALILTTTTNGASTGIYDNEFTIDAGDGDDELVIGEGEVRDRPEDTEATITDGRYTSIDVDLGGGNDSFTNTTLSEDTVDGGTGDDEISAGGGDDLLIGGAGSDLLIGGDGADTFDFADQAIGSDMDTVQDYSYGEGDILDISELVTFDDGGSDVVADFIQATNDGAQTTLSVSTDGGVSYTEIAVLDGIAGGDTLKVVLDDAEHEITVASL